MENNSNIHYQEDEIDLRELFKTIAKNKKLIILFTTIVTLLSIIWVFLKTPIYEAKAILKIGYYTTNNNNNNNNNIINNNYKKVMLDNASSLAQELRIIFIDLLENEKVKISKITDIKILKKQDNFLSISAQSINNNLASEEINKVVNFIKTKHKKILTDLEKTRKLNIKKLENQIIRIKTKELPMLNNKVVNLKKDINYYSENLKILSNNIKLIKKTNPALAMLEINEQKNLREVLFTLKNDLIDLENKIFNLDVNEVSNLNEQINNIKLLLKPYNYKNTYIIGNIITNDYPIKPKKILIVIVAFITGLILSIFLVFILEFFRNENNK